MLRDDDRPVRRPARFATQATPPAVGHNLRCRARFATSASLLWLAAEWPGSYGKKDFMPSLADVKRAFFFPSLGQLYLITCH